jgi:RNA polymerase sigma-70 factor (ECF subfamily)
MVERTPPIAPEVLIAHTEWVRRLTQRLVLDGAAADDAAQQTLLHALEREGAEVRHPRAWLASIARSVVRRMRRGQERRARHEAAAPPRQGEEAAADVVARASLHRAVVEAVLALAEPYRSTILMRFFEDVDAREVARRLDVPLETVRTRLKRGLALLRERLDASKEGRGYALLAAPLVPGAAAVAPALKLAAAALLAASLAVGVWRFTRSDELPASAGRLARAARSDATGDAREAGEAPPVSAAPPPSPAREPDAPSRTEDPIAKAAAELRGVVLDERGAPVAGALVFVEDALEPTWRSFHDTVTFAQIACDRMRPPEGAALQTTSAADGSFVLALPRDGKWCVGAVHADAGYAWRSGLRVSAAAPSAPIRFVLTPGLVVLGDVTDERGAPVPDARVAFVIRSGGGTITLGWPVTDRLGHYATPPLPMRDLEVWSVRARGFHSPPRCSVALEPGERVHRLDFRLAAAPVLHGRLLDRNGAPVDLAQPVISALQIRACGEDSEARPTLNHADGALGAIDRTRSTFELTPDAPGTSFVAAVVGSRVLDAARIVPGRDEADLVIDVSQLMGTSSPPDPGRKCARLSVVAKDAATGAPLDRYSIVWKDGGNVTGRECDDPAGVFELGEVAFGTCEITLSKRQYAPSTRSVEVGSDALATERPLEFALERFGGALTGRVRTASAGAAAGVHVLLLDELGAPFLDFPDGEEWTDANGAFTIDHLPTTSCLLVAEDERAAPRVVRCEPSSAPTPIELALDPGVRVDLVARDEAGAAVGLDEPWRLRVWDDDRRPVVDTGIAGRRTPPVRDGAIALRLAAGRYYVELNLRGFLAGRQRFVVSDDTTLSLPLTRESPAPSVSK